MTTPKRFAKGSASGSTGGWPVASNTTSARFAAGVLLHERQGVAGTAGELVGGAVGAGPPPGAPAAGRSPGFFSAPITRAYWLRSCPSGPRPMTTTVAPMASWARRTPVWANGGELRPRRRVVADRIRNLHRNAAGDGDLVMVGVGEHALAGGRSRRPPPRSARPRRRCCNPGGTGTAPTGASGSRGSDSPRVADGLGAGADQAHPWCVPPRRRPAAPVSARCAAPPAACPLSRCWSSSRVLLPWSAVDAGGPHRANVAERRPLRRTAAPARRAPSTAGGKLQRCIDRTQRTQDGMGARVLRRATPGAGARLHRSGHAGRTSRRTRGRAGGSTPPARGAAGRRCPWLRVARAAGDPGSGVDTAAPVPV